MHFQMITARHLYRFVPAMALIALAGAVSAHGQERNLVLSFVPAQTKIDFTLTATLHNVHGSFNLTSGTVRFNPKTGTLSGEFVVDAASGQSGTSSRDAKMHNEVLDSPHYREITFLPDHEEGAVAPQGKSLIQVHGMFSIHGAPHEITIPVEVEMAPGRWSAGAHFSVPYVQWGMRNPSNFILRVGQTVDIDVHATGSLPGGE